MYLIHFGNILRLLPPAPARVLDLGVGTGWTTCFFGRAGYEAVGVDIADSMIELARKNAERYESPNTQFIVSDYEGLAFEEVFEAAVFYDSLHHAIDEREALACAFRALKPGGVLICHEPASGHAEAAASVDARERYDITERDMPPERIVRVGLEVGFSTYSLYGHSWEPFRLGPIQGVTSHLKLLWRKLMDFLGAVGESRKAYQRRNLVVLRK